MTWGTLPALISLLSVALMSCASFLPYVQYSWTDGIFSFPSGAVLPRGPAATTSLAQGSDAVLVLVTLVVLGVAAVAHFVGIRRRFTGVASFGASLLAVAIAGSFQATLVVGSPGIDYGFYVFVVAATVAAIAGLVMVVMSFRGSRLRTDTALRPIPD